MVVPDVWFWVAYESTRNALSGASFDPGAGPSAMQSYLMSLGLQVVQAVEILASEQLPMDSTVFCHHLSTPSREGRASLLRNDLESDWSCSCIDRQT
jgi:hypothetical protein